MTKQNPETPENLESQTTNPKQENLPRGNLGRATRRVKVIAVGKILKSRGRSQVQMQVDPDHLPKWEKK